MTPRDERTKKHRRALLVFVRGLALELSVKHWPKRLAPLLRLPEGLSRVSADVHLFVDDGPFAVPEVQGTVHRQVGGTFGARLGAAIEELSDAGYREVVVVGRDCPELELSDVRAAFESLEDRPVVLGPDHRGGVYLIGFRISQRRLLEGVPWCRDRDFEALTDRVAEGDLRILPSKQDLDSAFDLRLLCRSSGPRGSMARAILASLETSDPKIPDRIRSRSAALDPVAWQMPPPAQAL